MYSLVFTWLRLVRALLVLGIVFSFTQRTWASPGSHTHTRIDARVDTTDKYWIFLKTHPEETDSSSAGALSRVYRAHLREYGIQPVVYSRWFTAVSAFLSPAERDTVRALPFVRRIAPVATGRLITSRSERRPSHSLDAASVSLDSLALGPSRGPLARINAVAPMKRGLDGRGVRVGFLDAHFRGLRHGAFRSLRAENRMLALRNFTEGTQGGNHGSAVASVTVGEAPGTLLGPARGANVLGATTEYTPSERNVEEDYFVAGLEWLHRRGADVVNVSIGYTTFDEGQNSYTPDDLDGDTGITTRAVDRAAEKGITMVVSAGNSGCTDPESCWYYVNTPADADSAITVGAITPDSSLASFSSRGPTADGRTKPDVVVQGEGVVAAWDDQGFAQVSGTSFASPQVTGIVALMLQVNPDLSPTEVRHLLRQTASQAQTPDNRKGWGVVNADAAVRAAERRARATPPSSMIVDAPYPDPASTKLTIPVRAPGDSRSVRISLVSPLGRERFTRTVPVRPGPNRRTIDVSSVHPGHYVYEVQGTRSLERGMITISR